jgi:hypothetical protein
MNIVVRIGAITLMVGGGKLICTRLPCARLDLRVSAQRVVPSRIDPGESDPEGHSTISRRAATGSAQSSDVSSFCHAQLEDGCGGEGLARDILGGASRVRGHVRIWRLIGGRSRRLRILVYYDF